MIGSEPTKKILQLTQLQVLVLVSFHRKHLLRLMMPYFQYNQNEAQ